MSVLKQIDSSELEDTFILYKELLHPYITEVYGWDEAYQRKRFSESYKLEDMFWYIEDENKKAFVCRSILDDAVHIQLLLVPKNHQNKGIGKRAMMILQSEAFDNHKDVTLSTFKCNKAAFGFYKTLGYSQFKEEKDFYNLKIHRNNV